MPTSVGFAPGIKVDVAVVLTSVGAEMDSEEVVANDEIDIAIIPRVSTDSPGFERSDARLSGLCTVLDVKTFVIPGVCGNSPPKRQ